MYVSHQLSNMYSAELQENFWPASDNSISTNEDFDIAKQMSMFSGPLISCQSWLVFRNGVQLFCFPPLSSLPNPIFFVSTSLLSPSPDKPRPSPLLPSQTCLSPSPLLSLSFPHSSSITGFGLRTSRNLSNAPSSLAILPSKALSSF